MFQECKPEVPHWRQYLFHTHTNSVSSWLSLNSAIIKSILWSLLFLWAIALVLGQLQAPKYHSVWAEVSWQGGVGKAHVVSNQREAALVMIYLQNDSIFEFKRCNQVSEKQLS